MAGLGWLRTGTITVTNGSKAVTGTDTIWGGGVVNPGDIILLPNGALGEVESVGSNTALTLKQAYAGATASAQPYAIIRMLPSGNVAADIAAQVTATSQRYHYTLDQLYAWMDSAGIVSFSDGESVLQGLYGLRKLMMCPALDSEGRLVLGAGQGVAAARATIKGSAVGIVTALALQNESNDPAGSGVQLVFKNSLNGVPSEDAKYGFIRYVATGNYGEQAALVFGTNNGLASPPVERVRIDAAGAMSMQGPVRTGQYTLSTLPSASTYNGYTITVSNASGGPALCLSNGTNWINVRTNTPVN